MPAKLPEIILFFALVKTFDATSAGIKNPLQVKRNIFVFPSIKSLSIITAKTKEKEYLIPRYAAARSIAPVTNSKFGPKSKATRSRNASKNNIANIIFLPRSGKLCLFIGLYILPLN